MTTWQRIRAYIRDNYEPAMDEPAWLGLVIPDPAGEAIQRIRIMHIADVEVPAIRVAADIGGEHTIEHRDALRCNRALATSSLALEGNGRYVLRWELGLDLLTLELFERALQGVIREAAMVRRLRTTALTANLFSTYVD